jgi:hypothetical protein
VQLNKDGVQKLFRLFGHFNLILLLLSATLSAQSFKDFKKIQSKSFQTYKDERDQAFSNYLKSEWEEYQAQDGIKLYEEPKPKNIFQVKEQKIVQSGPKLHLKLIKPKKKAKTSHQPLGVKDIKFDFFGSNVGFSVDANMKSIRYFPRNQEGIANYFSSMAKSDYALVVKELQDIKNDLLLNDWGVYLLVKKLAEKSFENEDEAKLFTWFLLNKLSYDVKIGLQSKSIVVMHYSKKLIYATPSYTFNEKKFYVLSHYAQGKMGRIYTYEQSYPGASKALDLSLAYLPNFEENPKSKELSFEQFGVKYTTHFVLNQNIIDFMATYPQADYQTFFNAPIEEGVYYSIAKDLRKYIDTKRASEGINFILKFVQKAFVYEIDDLQFGREKVMFAEETLYYNKSDCEDRAILFSYLVKELFGISVVGVKYKNHMATGLYIPFQGDSVKKGKKRYVIADPTFINANLGQSMPKYKSVIPQSFIQVKKN